MNPSTTDPVIDEIREIRHRISARYDHDPAKLVAYLMQFQQQFRDRLVYDATVESAAQSAAQQGAQPDREQSGELNRS